MREQVVPYEIALLLKQKNFTDRCWAGYECALKSKKNEQDGHSGPFGWKKGECNFNTGYYENNSPSADYSNESWIIVAAPFWQQVIHWFDITHNIDISVVKRSGLYFYEVATSDKILTKLGANTQSRIEAIRAGIKFALKLI